MINLESQTKNLYITGEAGTGKTTLIKELKQKSSKNVVILAPTGVAAVTLGGQTIHKFFSFYIDITETKIQNNEYILPRKKVEMIQKLDILIIDEISMVRADLLDCVNACLKKYRENDMPFGGVQVILVGDLLQLPPIVKPEEEEIFNKIYESPFFFSSKAYKEAEFEKIVLDHIYRQKDEDFKCLLNKIRNCEMDKDDLFDLNKCLKTNIDKSQFYIYLTSTNKRQDYINLTKLNNLKGQIKEFKAKISGDFKPNNCIAKEILQIKPQAQIMMINNDKKDRWINGTLAKILKINEESIVVKLENGKITTVFPYTWETIEFFINKNKIDSRKTGEFTQFPFILAWAITIHKSQSKTYDQIILDTTDKIFAPGQLYVALSRATSKKRVRLIKPISFYDIKPYHNQVLQHV